MDMVPNEKTQHNSNLNGLRICKRASVSALWKRRTTCAITGSSIYHFSISRSLCLHADLLLTNSSFILILSDSHRGCLVWVKCVEIPSKNLKASLMSFTCTLFSDEGRCFNQSERALYGNFIIKNEKLFHASKRAFSIGLPLLSVSHNWTWWLYLNVSPAKKELWRRILSFSSVYPVQYSSEMSQDSENRRAQQCLNETVRNNVVILSSELSVPWFQETWSHEISGDRVQCLKKFRCIH